MSFRSVSLVAIGLCTALLFVAGESRANLIVNGDFETGDLSGWTPYETVNGTIGTPIVVDVDVTGNGDSPAAAFKVGQMSAINDHQEGGGLKQTFESGAGAFTMTADIASFLLIDGASNIDFGTFSLLLDGTTLASESFGSGFAPLVFRGSLSFSGVLTAGTHELKVEMTRARIVTNNSPRQFVDNIVVDGLAPTPFGDVPEPFTIALFGIGLAGLGLSRRK